MFDNLPGGWGYDDIVGELAAVVVQQCSHEDTGSRVGSSAAAAAVVAAVVVVAAAVVVVVAAAVAAGVGVAAAEVTG